jgi:hypothetical protein
VTGIASDEIVTGVMVSRLASWGLADRLKNDFIQAVIE